MEAEIRMKGKKAAASAAIKGKPMQIRGQTAKVEDNGGVDDGSGLPAWKENSLVPEGWQKMSLPDKVSQLYLGRRGLLFWSNKIAFGAAMSLIGGWIVFRFVGPALGLYQLQGDLQTTLN